jgi:uncharacterized protein YhaN
MEIDLERWAKLLDQIAALTATSRGFNEMIAVAERRRNAASADLAAAEAYDAATPLARPSAPRVLSPGAILTRDGAALADGVEQREAQLEPLRRQLAEMDDELRRLTSAHEEVFEKLTRLRRVEVDCRKWAAENNIVLPGESRGVSSAVLQPGPRGQAFAPRCDTTSGAEIEYRAGDRARSTHWARIARAGRRRAQSAG